MINLCTDNYMLHSLVDNNDNSNNSATIWTKINLACSI